MASFTQIQINGLLLKTHLGWGAKERQKVQPIRVDAWLRFQKVPLACKTDDLKETVCYGQVSDCIRELIEKREFRLIEYMAAEAYNAVKKEFLQNKKIDFTIKITKLKAPVKNLKDGSVFWYGDFSV